MRDTALRLWTHPIPEPVCGIETGRALAGRVRAARSCSRVTQALAGVEHVSPERAELRLGRITQMCQAQHVFDGPQKRIVIVRP